MFDLGYTDFPSFPATTTEEEKEKRLQFLKTEAEFDQSLNRPDAKSGELPKLRKGSLEEAIKALHKEIVRFFEFHENNPNQTPMH